MWVLTSLLLLLLAPMAAQAQQQPKRVLYVTHSAGFRHGSLPVSSQVMRSVAQSSGGRLAVTVTEDVSQLNAAGLSGYDAVFFFTSGELPVSDVQKQDLLAFVRSGKGFGGAHSATDTFYTWPEYGALIGAYFNGHPWTQSVKIDAEDLRHPAAAPAGPAFELLEEIYQFRDFSRENTRVLLRLDPASVNLALPNVNPRTLDFPLAWVRPFGAGRVFYTALGHFDETWLAPRFQQMLLGALLWLTGQAEGDATPRPLTGPVIALTGNAASVEPRNTVSPGSIISVFGTNLGGASVSVNGEPSAVLYASPSQINAFIPPTVTPRVCVTTPCPAVTLDVRTAEGSASSWLSFAPRTPGLFTATRAGSEVTLWMTGLGAVEERNGFSVTTLLPSVSLGGAAARVLYSGLAPGWTGLYQVNVTAAPGVTFPAKLEFRMGEAAAGGNVP